MRNKHKWYSILLIGLVILLASSIVACGESYTQKELDAASEAAYTKGYHSGLAKGESVKEEVAKQSYDKGYWAGYRKGQGEGYDRGHADGKAEGYEQGYAQGREIGESIGYASGWFACRKTCGDGTQLDGYKYVGSIKSDVYYYPWCRYVKQIYPENKIWFNSASDARAHGYRPCKVCSPP